MASILQRFLSFDRLLGTSLVKLIYYVAAAGIVLFTGIGMVAGLIGIFSGNLGGGLMQIIATPVVGAVALVYWRFLCELFLLAFLTYDRLGEVRTLLTPVGAAPPEAAPDPNHPAF